MNEQRVGNASKHAQIIDAAQAEFLENGFGSASMDRIAKRADVSKRTLYKYFESKENLFRSLVQVLWSRDPVLTVPSGPSNVPVRERLYVMAEAKVRIYADADVIALARMIISEMLRNPELAVQTEGKFDTKAQVEDIFREAVAAGQMQPHDTSAAATEFLGLIKAKTFWPAVFGEPVADADDIPAIVDSCVEMMMRRYGS